jgi:hypothetical protein
MISIKFEIKTIDESFVFGFFDTTTDFLKPEHFGKAVKLFIKAHNPNMPTRAIKSVKVLEITNFNN